MKRAYLSVLFIAVFQLIIAGEGMWLPLLLKQLNEAEMQSMGMKMSAEDIYSINKGSLKDAIVHFGGFCTSEVISSNGLLLTNWHCGRRNIQSHSSLEHNYLRDGFWAKSHGEELHNPGLSATFIVRIEDVTKGVLTGVGEDMSDGERQAMIDKNINTVITSTQKEDYEDVFVKPFFKGNQYFSFITITYKDVRLVGTPPQSIGEFGKDTDNWVWPRHTGDFSLFRIYAGKDNLPADYSLENVPYKPRHFLPISLDGVESGDFTLVFGFPGSTNEYLPAVAVEQIVDVLNPARIGIRDVTLKILDEEMRTDEKVRIQYTSKFSSLSNSWKRWKGEILGINKTKGINRKKSFEAEFNKALVRKPALKRKYDGILQKFKSLYKEIEPYALAREYYREVMGRNVELLRATGLVHRMVAAYENNGETGYNQMRDRLKGWFERFYKDYRSDIDQQVFLGQFKLMQKMLEPKFVAPVISQGLESAGGSAGEYTEGIYYSTVFTNLNSFTELMGLEPAVAVEKIKADPVYKLHRSMTTFSDENISSRYNEYNREISNLQKTYMKALMEVFPEKTFYPDANSTMRVTYGKVNGYQARDAVKYEPITYLAGIMEKYKPGDYEFDVPKKLEDLYISKDFGPYGEDGKMPVCFVGTNHTTGGNSGSPAIDAHGNLIGLNFDRAWEGVMSDYNYDPSICRNIMVDIRYVLFIVDKFAGAGHLVEEMKLVHPKKVKSKLRK